MDEASKKTLKGASRLATYVIAIPMLALIVAIVSLKLVGASGYVVQGDSMNPTLSSGEYLVIGPHRGDVGDIIAFYPNEAWNESGVHIPDNGVLLKRVVAVAGDTISVSGDSVYINGDFADELPGDCSFEQSEERELTKGEYFVMGDNREESLDSRAVLCSTSFDDSIVNESQVLAVGAAYTWKGKLQ